LTVAVFFAHFFAHAFGLGTDFEVSGTFGLGADLEVHALVVADFLHFPPISSVSSGLDVWSSSPESIPATAFAFLDGLITHHWPTMTSTATAPAAFRHFIASKG